MVLIELLIVVLVAILIFALIAVLTSLRSSLWSSLRSSLFISQECFPHKVYAAYIIKPEKFWEKQKTSLGSAKYKFEVGPPFMFEVGPSPCLL